MDKQRTRDTITNPIKVRLNKHVLKPTTKLKQNVMHILHAVQL